MDILSALRVSVGTFVESIVIGADTLILPPALFSTIRLLAVMLLSSVLSRPSVPAASAPPRSMFVPAVTGARLTYCALTGWLMVMASALRDTSAKF